MERGVPRRRRPRPVVTEGVEGLLLRGEELAKGWLLALVEDAPLEEAAAILAGDVARDGPRICDAVVRAIYDEADLRRIETGGVLEPLVSRAGEIAGVRSAEAAAHAVDTLRSVVWSALRTELERTRPGPARRRRRAAVAGRRARASGGPAPPRRGRGRRASRPPGPPLRVARPDVPSASRGRPAEPGRPERRRGRERGRRDLRVRRDRSGLAEARQGRGARDGGAPERGRGRLGGSGRGVPGSGGRPLGRSAMRCGSARSETRSCAPLGLGRRCRCCWSSSRRPSGCSRSRLRRRRARRSGGSPRRCGARCAGRDVLACETETPGLDHRARHRARRRPGARVADRHGGAGGGVVARRAADRERRGRGARRGRAATPPSLIDAAEQTRFAAEASGIGIVTDRPARAAASRRPGSEPGELTGATARRERRSRVELAARARRRHRRRRCRGSPARVRWPS